ncbi:MAG TPA: hypothetical protein VFS43_01575 [Polyangiaceae bacterium]|nr:hypothetical protein [Polyangiaceae bacterium]
MRSFVLLSFAFFVLAPAAGCQASAAADAEGEGPDGPSGPGARPAGLSEADARAVCTTIWRASCEKVEACAPFSVELSSGDVEGCVAANVDACMQGYVLSGVSVTAAEAGACARALEARPCESVAAVRECQFAGKIADGRACLADAQCASRLCRLAPKASCGTCVTPGKEGAACADDEPCAEGLRCDGGSKKCVRRGAPGAPCASDDECEAWAVCGEGKACVEAGRAAGQPCTSFGGCNERQSLACGSVGDRCYRLTAMAAPGEACPADEASNEATGCRAGLCDLRTDTCVGTAGKGEACGVGQENQSCGGPYRCLETDAGRACGLRPVDESGCR